MSKLQIIHDDAGKPIFAVLPWLEYVRLSKDESTETLLSDEEIYDLARDEGGNPFPLKW